MPELLWCVTGMVSVAAGCAWVADRVPDAWVDVFVRVMR
jgi:hypothetical protein